eukprot:g1345.t1
MFGPTAPQGQQQSAGVSPFTFGSLFSDAARMRAAMEASQEEANKGAPPTKRSVLNRLRETCLDLEDVQNGNDVCTICLDEQHVGDLAIKLKCGHCFHKKCVWPWLEQHCTCPVCRLEHNDEATGATGASSREKAMRRAHHRNVETRRKSHAQTVAEQRQRMEMMEREEREGRRRQESGGVGEAGGKKKGAQAGGEGKDGDEGKGSPEKKRRRYADGSTSPSRPSFSNSDYEAGAASMAASGAAVSSSRTEYGDANFTSSSSDDGPAWAMASALLASGISIGSMRGLLENLGLGGHAVGALEKRDLAHTLALACSRDHLLTLKVSELRRRARELRVDIYTCFDKRGIVEVLHDAVVVVVEQGTRW